MHFRYIPVLLLLVCLPHTGTAATHTIVDAGLSFSPATLNINVGDTVVFSLATMHNAVEVSQTTWNNNGNTSNGGFNLPFGGGTVIFPVAGTYYYVCAPHAGAGMKGIINVVLTTVTTGSITPTTLCKGAAIQVPFTATGSFGVGNIFTAQLSDAGGSFAAPTNIGTLAATTSGQITATVPTGASTGNGYRIRVVSSSPAVIGTNNGSDLNIVDAVTAQITPAGVTTFCEGDDVTLNANTGTGYTYIWKRNGTVIPGATADSYVAALAGLYTVEVSNGSCTATSAAVRVTVIPSDPTTLTWVGSVSTDWATPGNWDNPCAIPTAGDTVIIGPGTVLPTGIPAVALNRLTLNNSTGIALSNDLHISGNLTLMSGTITLNNAHLSFGATASITGGTATSFIVTNGLGELRQAGIGSGGRSGTILFPIGPNTNTYTPVQIMNSSTQDEFRVRTRAEVLSGGSSGSQLTMDVVGITWLIEEASAGGSNATLTFQWNSGDELGSFDRGACYVGHHDGADWIALQSPGAAGGSGPYNRVVTGVTSFSPFAIGDGDSPLPVEFRSFTADVHGSSVSLRWETASEVNNLGFEVERRLAGSPEWATISFIPSAAAPGAGHGYVYHDHPPVQGQWLYRLRQIDVDGTAAYSSVVTASVTSSLTGLVIESVYPNPLRNTATSEILVRFRTDAPGTASITLHDMLGRQIARVFSGVAMNNGSTTVRFDAASLATGIYMLRLEQENRATAAKLVIRN
ncbi:MAG: T9SS type A sorting domain-containing protein [Bacteroidia bacterium]|nr:T9SS type A sorting domain-containing protein [Bacteroidia bacterium]